jgi:integrase
VLKTAALRAKIQGPIGWHTLRHSHRAWLDETGAPLGIQQKLLRHTNNLDHAVTWRILAVYKCDHCIFIVTTAYLYCQIVGQ